MLGNQSLMNIEHLYSECKLNAMLIPYGIYKNAWVERLRYGEKILTSDDPPITIRVLDKLVIPVGSTIANSMSMLIYGRPIEVIFDAMFRNFGHDIQRKNVILLIYEPLED